MPTTSPVTCQPSLVPRTSPTMIDFGAVEMGLIAVISSPILREKSQKFSEWLISQNSYSVASDRDLRLGQYHPLILQCSTFKFYLHWCISCRDSLCRKRRQASPNNCQPTSKLANNFFFIYVRLLLFKNFQNVLLKLWP